MSGKAKPDTRKIQSPLDDQLDDSFPASDPPSLTNPSQETVSSPPDPAEIADAARKAKEKKKKK